MRRYALSLLLLLLVGCLVAGCFEDSAVLLPNGAECGGLTVEDAAECEGGVCLGLNPNVQGMSGFCSASCYVEEDCNPHESCESITDGTFCFRRCNDDDDCYDKFVCRLLKLGDSKRFCLVDPI